MIFDVRLQLADVDGGGLRSPWATSFAEVVVDLLILVSKQIQQPTARLQLSIQILETTIGNHELAFEFHFLSSQ